MISISLFCLWLIAFMKGFGASAGNLIYRIVFLAILPLLFVKVIYDKHTVKETLSLLVIFLSGVLNFILTRHTTVLFAAIIIPAMQGEHFEKIASVTLQGRILGFITALSLFLLGINKEVITMQWRIDEFVSRHSLGFGHPNIAHESFTMIALISLYVYYRRIKWFHLVFLAAVNYILLTLTLSRSGFLIVSVALVVFAVLKSGMFHDFFRFCFYCFYPAVLLMSFLTAYFYRSVGAFHVLDKLLTGRLELSHMAIINYTPALWGSAKNVGITLDNGYLRLLYEGGIIPFLWFTYYAMRLNRYLYQTDRQKEQFLFSMMNLYTITESFWFSPAVNVSILLIGQVLFHKKNTLSPTPPPVFWDNR